MQRVERLTNSSDVKVENIRFGKYEFGRVQEKDVFYKRIPITIMHDDNLHGSLLIPTKACFSFGVQQNVNKDTGLVSGWSLPIVMYNRDGVTEEQLEWVVKFDEIVERCKDYVMEKKEGLQLYNLEREQLDKIGGCMWWPKIDTERGPTLYLKIISGKSLSQKRFDTKFRLVKDLQDYDEFGVDITKEELMEYCNVIAVIKIDSIYICGENISLQVKVVEALVEKQESLPSFLRPVVIEANAV